MTCDTFNCFFLLKQCVTKNVCAFNAPRKSTRITIDWYSDHFRIDYLRRIAIWWRHACCNFCVFVCARNEIWFMKAFITFFRCLFGIRWNWCKSVLEESSRKDETFARYYCAHKRAKPTMCPQAKPIYVSPLFRETSKLKQNCSACDRERNREREIDWFTFISVSTCYPFNTACVSSAKTSSTRFSKCAN